mmetsp:Transcript_10097/g.11020  ORF Transcript_10097/g.11020 Transcript_10097/m.11020 type:complete len:101 (+) Transcript_10097:331-633(+)
MDYSTFRKIPIILRPRIHSGKHLFRSLAPAQAFYGLGEHEKAIECYDYALIFYPEDPQIHHLKGHSLELLKKPEEALNSFEKALSKDPETPNCIITEASI